MTAASADEFQGEFFKSGNIVVNANAVQVQGRTYPLNTLATVDVHQPQRPIYAAAGLLAFAAAGLVWLNGSLLPAVFLLALGLAFCLAMLNRPYTLVLKTTRGSQQSLTHNSGKFVHSVKTAIERAMASQA